MFEQVKISRTFEDIIGQIEQAILNKSLKPGDKLPSERHLTEIFKVSRGTLREALRSLEQRKLIKIKTGVGGGAVVCEVGSLQVSESLEFLMKYKKITIDELMEFREIVEGGFVAAATKKIRREDINELELILSIMEQYLQEGLDKYDEDFELDRKFHIVLARVTNNRMYDSVTHTLYDNINKYFESYLIRDLKIVKNTYKELTDILNAIKKGDAELARKNMQIHISRYGKLMRKREREFNKSHEPSLTGRHGKRS